MEDWVQGILDSLKKGFQLCAHACVCVCVVCVCSDGLLYT